MEDKISKKAKIRNLISFRPYTIVELNHLVNTTESRKRISELKQEGYNVQSTIINKRNGTKSYWIKNN